MKKSLKKVLCALLCGVISVGIGGGLVGCGESLEQVDNTRTQLWLGVHSGGYGEAWIKDLKERFEDYTKDMTFQEGRLGVQVLYEEDKAKYNAGALFNNFFSGNYEVFMVSGQEVYDYLDNDYLLDITEAATTTLTRFGETRSIEDKMNALQKDFYKADDGKYYSLPLGAGTYGIIYDVDVFEDYNLYIAKDGAPSEALQPDGYFDGEYQFTGRGDKSAGPDGLYGTVDDGLAATLEEFYKMMDHMLDQEVIPLTYTGAHALSYAYFPVNAFAWNYQGVNTDIISLGSSNGVTLRIVDHFDEDGNPVITEKRVNNDNLPDYAKNAGFYYGLSMMETMVKNGYLDTEACFEGMSHTSTQLRFLSSKFSLSGKPIAMMAEGDWWETEAEEGNAFKDTTKSYGDEAKRENRNFAILTMPHATAADIGKKNTVSYNNNHLIVRNDVSQDKLDLINLFIQFALSDESNVQYTIKAGAPRALNYEIPVEKQAELSTFVKQSWDFFRSSNVRYAYYNREVVDNARLMSLTQDIGFFTSVNMKGVKFGTFTEQCKYSGTTARGYFEGMYRQNESLASNA